MKLRDHGTSKAKLYPNTLDKNLFIKEMLGKKILKVAQNSYGIDPNELIPHQSFSAIHSSRSTDYNKEYIN